MSNFKSCGVGRANVDELGAQFDANRRLAEILGTSTRFGSTVSLLLVFWLLSGIDGASRVFAQTGRFETTTFESPALAANVWGDPSQRSARVYLPPSYRSSEKRYPVLYLLPGTGAPANMTNAAEVLGNANSLIRDRSMEEMIIVEVDDRAAHYGYGVYTNSAVQGNHADYVANDLVEHIDTTYRTVAGRDSRGVAGFSLGGRGTLTLAMQRSDVFGAAYAVGVSPLCFSRPECSEQLFEDTARFSEAGENYWGITLAKIVAEHAQVETPDQVPDDIDLSMAAAFSPNVDNPPLYVDFPYELNEGLKVIPEIRDKWYQHDLLFMLDNHAKDLASLRGLVIEVGDKDLPLVPEHELFHQALTDAGVPHEFRTYPGGHLDLWSERFQLAAQFFSDTLVSPEPVRDCDFNIDAACDVVDVDDLISRFGSSVELYDLNKSGTVEFGDLELIIQNELGTWIGDADLNGEVDFGDFLALSAHFRQDGGWAQGDFDASGDVQFADFLLLSSNFGNAREATLAQSVPEPNTCVLTVLSCCLWLLLQRRELTNDVRVCEIQREKPQL